MRSVVMAKQDELRAGPVNVAGDLRRMIAHIVTHRQVRVQDYLDPIIRQAVEEDFNEVVNEMEKLKRQPPPGAAPAG